MRHCRVTVLHMAATALAPCILLLILGSCRPSQVRVLTARGAYSGHGHARHSDIALKGQPQQRRVWLYSLIGADFPGAAALLQHWLRHYTDLGFASEQMILAVHSNNDGALTTGNLGGVTRVLQSRGITFECWTGTPYSSDAHLEIKLRLLRDRVASPEDWIVIADSDEFYDFDAIGPGIQGYVNALEAADASFGAGMLVDRVAADGSLLEVQAVPSLPEQFGLHCAVVRRLTRGFPWKVVAHRAYLRTNTGNHRVVSAHTAAKYFGPALPGKRSPRGGFHGASDLYNLTPYAAYPASYVCTKQQLPAAGGLWRAALYPAAIAAMHFKWHSGVLQSATVRLHHYRGNTNDERPRYEHFVESERILERLQNGTLPLQKAGCMKDMPWRVRPPPTNRLMYI